MTSDNPKMTWRELPNDAVTMSRTEYDALGKAIGEAARYAIEADEIIMNLYRQLTDDDSQTVIVAISQLMPAAYRARLTSHDAQEEWLNHA